MDFPRKEFPALSGKEVLEFQITDWYIPEADRTRERDDEELYSILIYGTTDAGATVCCKVKEFTPYFYVKPPASWEDLPDSEFNAKMEEFKNKVMSDSYEASFKKDTYRRKILPKKLESHLKKITIVRRKDFWGFTNNREFRFMKVIVKSLKLYNGLKYYFASLEKSGFKLYESNIDPFLKYIHVQNIKPCNWVRIEKYECGEDISRCNYNIEVKHKHIVAIDVAKIAPMLITSFDIECTSSHGDFPVAIKDYRKLAQDLSLVARAGYEYDKDTLENWIQNIYSTEIVIEEATNLKINCLYAKKKLTQEFIQTIPKLLAPIMNDVIACLDKISSNAGGAGGSRAGEEESDDDDEPTKVLNVRELNEEETKLTELFSSVLPKLEGDKIIQIGTTTHRYGSDEIIHRNIITLNTCNSIAGCDVVECKTEKQLLLKWKELINELNPDVITGYNIFGFDMEYIWQRAQECGIIDDFCIGLGRLLDKKCSLIEQKLSSSAMGENILKYFEMDGIVMIDLFKVMQREQKLDSYKLDNVATIFLGDKKDDLKPHEIFEKFKGSAEDRCIIAKYCIQDCCLVNRLVHKLKILENNIGMGNVCLVPLNFLFRRGQGIKIFSLIAKQCMDKGFLIPSIKSYNENKDMEEGYEGAIVLEPKEAIYLNEPIVVFDYGSLYPSSMIARNLSHDTYVLDEKYNNLDLVDPNIYYTTVSYDIYEGLGDKKRKTGEKKCTFAQYKDGRKGIIPDILNMLLQERKNARKKIEYQTAVLKDGSEVFGAVSEKGDVLEYQNVDTGVVATVSKTDVASVKDTYSRFEQDVFDALQLAYKITANSLYGQIGARTSPVYLKDIAASTTATGREMIMIAKEFVETNYGAEVVYGDSVMPYTPITYILNDSKLMIDTFENIQGQWKDYSQFKPQDTDRYYKEQLNPDNMKVWTHRGWAKVRRIIRHLTTKKIYRVLTHTGLVDVTEDHSLLDGNCEIIKPSECVVGQPLLHSKPDLDSCNGYYNDVSEAYVYGVFVGAGSCASTWYISHTDKDLLVKCKNIIERDDDGMVDIIESSGMFILIATDKAVKHLCETFGQDCYVKNAKIVPTKILNSRHLEVLEEFSKGLIDSEMSWVINDENQVTAQSYCVLFQKLGYNVSINMHKLFTYSKTEQSSSSNAIKKIEVLYDAYDGYVYDIETEEGVFHAGVGNMILKNTDSIFCKFPLKDGEDNRIYGKDSLPYAIEIGKNVEKNIVKIMPKPQKLNYEKCLYPFILFSKKRYVGNLYEMDVDKFKQKSMGIVLKRRDNAPIVKKIFGGIIDIILNKQDLESSIEFLKEELSDLVGGKAPIEDLVISKSLRGHYKDPSKIAHKVLADRIGARDPGNKPVVNDRIPFVYIKVPNASTTLQGDRIENPEYIMENGLVPDYLHYITNQIMKPVLQLYALCLDQLPRYDKDVMYWKTLDEELKKKPFYVDDIKRRNRIDNLKLAMVKELLFDEYINMLSEPKIRKKKTTAVMKDIVEVPKVPKEAKPKPEKVPKVPKEAKPKPEKVPKIPKEVNEVKEKKAKKTKETNDVIEAVIKTKVPKEAKEVKEKKVKETTETIATESSDVMATVKVTGSKGNLTSSAYITEKNKKIWTYDNNQVSDKIRETMDIICIIAEKYPERKIKVKTNNKALAKDYKIAEGKYQEFMVNQSRQFDLVENAMESLDTGILKDIAFICKFEKLLKIKERFDFV